MEYETINKETPEMKQLISGIKGLTNRVRSIAQTHRPPFEGEISSQDGRFARDCSFPLAPCKTIETKTLSLTPKSQGKSSTGSQT